MAYAQKNKVKSQLIFDYVRLQWWLAGSVVGPQIFLSDPQPWITDPGRPINYESGRIRILPKHFCGHGKNYVVNRSWIIKNYKYWTFFCNIFGTLMNSMDQDPVPDPEGQKITDSLYWFQVRQRNSPLYGMHSTVETKEKDSRNRKVPKLSLLSLLGSFWVCVSWWKKPEGKGERGGRGVHYVYRTVKKAYSASWFMTA